MSLNQVTWQPVCCADHDGYAEAPTNGGGVMRLFRHLDGGLSMTRFGPDNRAIDRDEAGVPIAVPCTEAEADALLA